MRIAIATASRHGGTHEVGEWIGAAFTEAFGDSVETVRVKCRVEPPTLIGPVDAVIVGGAIYAGAWPNSGQAFVRTNLHLLQQVPVLAFSCGLGQMDRMIDLERVSGCQVPVVEHRSFGGVVRTSDLSLPERLLIRAMRVEAADTRPRDEICCWALSFGWTLLRRRRSGWVTGNEGFRSSGSGSSSRRLGQASSS